MQSIDLISSIFSLDNSLSYNISIREKPNGFCLCAYDFVTKKCVALKTTEKLVFTEEPLLSMKYNKITYIKQSIFALIPKALSDSSSIKSFLLTEKQIQNRLQIETNEINNNLVLAFDCKTFPTNIQTCEFIHPMSLLLNFANNINDSNITMVEQDGENINIVVKQNNKITLANSFIYNTNEDAAYYLLATYQQLNLDVIHHTTLLCGNIEDINELRNFAKEYINHINIITPKNHILWDNNFPQELYPLVAPFITQYI